MKAIIISDESNTIEIIDRILVGYGFDTIIYRWLLKALDNIEEIRPNLVIVSVNEYPRHWKTLTQFITSGIGGDSVKVLLLCQTPLSEDERQKAFALGVGGFFAGVTEDGIKQLEAFLKVSYQFQSGKSSVLNSVSEKGNSAIPENDDYDDMEVPTVSKIIGEKNSVTQTENQASVQKNTTESSISENIPKPSISEKRNAVLLDSVLLFTNPYTGKMITGKVNSYRKRIVEFIPENRELVIDIKQSDTIETLTFEIDSKVRNYKAIVVSKTDRILLKLVEEING